MRAAHRLLTCPKPRKPSVDVASTTTSVNTLPGFSSSPSPMLNLCPARKSAAAPAARPLLRQPLGSGVQQGCSPALRIVSDQAQQQRQSTKQRSLYSIATAGRHWRRTSRTVDADGWGPAKFIRKHYTGGTRGWARLPPAPPLYSTAGPDDKRPKAVGWCSRRPCTTVGAAKEARGWARVPRCPARESGGTVQDGWQVQPALRCVVLPCPPVHSCVGALHVRGGRACPMRLPPYLNAGVE
jgi:hypothetical protein